MKSSGTMCLEVAMVKIREVKIKTEKALGATTTSLATNRASQRIDQDSRGILFLVGQNAKGQSFLIFCSFPSFHFISLT